MAERNEHKDRTHAVCSASGAERWLNCPGSVGLAMKLPPMESGAAALEGTRAHELAERVLRKWEADGRRLSEDWVDTLRPAYRDTEVPTGDGRTWSMVDYAMTYVNCCLDEVASFDCGEKEAAVRIEHRLVLDERLEMFGTVDFFATGLRGGRAYGVVVDLKYGKKRVKGDSVQLAYYAAALKRNSKKPLEAVKVRVVQPRLDDFYSDFEYTAEELEVHRVTLMEGAALALRMADGRTPPAYKAGGWCYFCPAWASCPERQRLAAEKAAEEFAAESLVLEEV